MIRSILRVALGKTWESRQEWSKFEYLRRIVCQVQEQCDPLKGTILLKITSKETSRFTINTHSCKHDGEIVFMVIMNAFGWTLDQTSLTTNLCSNFVVRQTSGREDGDFLSSSNRVHSIDGRDTCWYHLLRIDSSVWIDWRAVNVNVIFSKDLWTLVDGLSRTCIVLSARRSIQKLKLYCVPSKIRPNISSDTGILRFWPVNSTNQNISPKPSADWIEALYL